MKRKLVSLAAALLMCVPSCVSAYGDGIMNSSYSNGEYTAYLKLQYDNMKVTDITADGKKAELLEFNECGKNEAIKTVFIADKSVSDDENRAVFYGVLREFLASSSENESFSLVSLGTDGIKTVSDFTGNQMQILNAAENMGSETGTIRYSHISEPDFKGEEDEASFERIIVFTSSENINSASADDFSECRVPVYFVVTDGGTVDGSIFDSAPGLLGYCAVSSDSDLKKAASMASDISCIYSVRAALSDEIIGNGGEKRISISVENEVCSLTVEECIDTGDNRFAAAEKSLNHMKTILAAVSLAALMLFAALIFVLRKRKTGSVTASETEPSRHTVPLSGKNEASGTVFGSVSTKLLFRDTAERKIVLTDTGNPEHVIEISSLKESVIGRNQSLSDVVIYNDKSVSQKHCRIFCRNSKVYISDLGSKNHTYVDNEEVTEETELLSGSTVRIGRTEFNVSIY